MKPRRMGLQLIKVAQPGGEDQPAEPDQVAVPDIQQIQQLGISRRIPEQAPPLGKRPVIVPEDLAVLRPQLADGPVQKGPPLCRAGLDQRQMPRGEHHTAQLAGEGPSPGLRDAVEPYLAPGPEQQFQFLFPALGVHQRRHTAPAGLPVHLQPGQVALLPIPEAPLPAEQPDALHQIGLALGVVPVDQVHPGFRPQVDLFQVPEVFKPQLIDLHRRLPQRPYLEYPAW